jgi:hypothetical protein
MPLDLRELAVQTVNHHRIVLSLSRMFVANMAVYADSRCGIVTVSDMFKPLPSLVGGAVLF